MKFQPKQLDLSKDLIFSGGNIDLAEGRILAGDGSATDPSYSFVSDPDTGMFLANTGEVAISAGSNAYMFLKEDGTIELTGTTGIAWQAGTTAERPDTPLDGIVRFNLDLERHETFIDDEWSQFVLSNDARIADSNVIYVDGDVTDEPNSFTSIAAALDSITDASTTKPYLVKVGGGLFFEPEIQMKPYVTVQGAGYSTAVIAATDTQHLFLGAPNSLVSDMTVTGVAGENKAAFYVNSANADSTAGFYTQNINFGENHTHVLVEPPTGSIFTVFVEGGVIGSSGGFTRGFVARGPGSGRINIRSLTTNGTVVPPDLLFSAKGPLCTVICTGSTLRCSNGLGGTALHLADGATARFLAVSILGFTKGLWVENDGAAPNLMMTGINLANNTMDIVIDHPSTTGHYQGVAARQKVSIASAAVSVFYSDPVTTGITAVGPVYLGPTHTKTTEMSELFSRSTTMGLLYGGHLSINYSDLVVSVAAGTGYASITDPIHRTAKIVWPNSTLTLPDESANYIFFTNTGVLSYDASLPDLSENIVLGRVITDNGITVWIDDAPVSAAHSSNKIETMLRESFGPVYSTGSIVTENASNARHLDITAGTYFFGSLEFNPVGATNSPLVLVGHVSGTFEYSANAVVAVPNDKYDNGTNLVNLTSGYYTRHSLYVAGDGPNEEYLIVYGQAQYATLVEVEAAALPLPPSTFMGSVTTLIASIVVKQGTTNIVEIFDHRPSISTNSSRLSAASDHGNLLGLLDDDHPQYLLSSGSRALGGDLNLNGHALTNVTTLNGIDYSTHASRHLPNGTDPLTTSSAVGLTATTTNATGTANALARADHTHEITGFQPLDSDLTAIAALTTSGYIVRTGAGTVATRSFTGSNNVILVTNGSGTASNTNITIADNVILPGAGSVTVPSGTTSERSTPTVGMLRYNTTLGRMEIYQNSTWNPVTVTADLADYQPAGSYQPLDSDLTAVSNLSTTGIVARTGDGTATTRAIAGTTNTIAVTNGDGVAGTPTITLANNPVVPGTVGILAPSGTTAQRVPTAGILRYNNETLRLETYQNSTWSNVTIATDLASYQPLATALTNISALGANGVVALSSTGVAVTRTITGTANQISVNNGTGVSGNPTISIPTNPTIPGNITSGTYNGVTVEGHAARHNPGGADAPATASAVGLSLATTNTEGTATSFARSDHTHVITGVQPSNSQLTALASFSSTGHLVRTAADTFAARTLTGTTGTITITNGSGVAGNPTITIADNVVLPGTAGFVSPTGTTAQRVNTTGAIRYNSETARLEAYFNAAWSNLVIPSDLTAGYQPLNAELTKLSGLATNGFYVKSSGIAAARTMTGTTNQIVVTNGDGASGNPTFTIADNPTLPGTGSFVMPSGTTAQRTASPTAGMFRYNTETFRIEGYVSGQWYSMAGTADLAGYQPLDSDLTSLAGLATTGLVARTATGTMATRAITGTTNQITVTNGDGVAGAPTLSIPTNPTIPGNITSGTYNGVTVETHASRHQPGGADAIPTAAATTITLSTTNGVGTSTSLARADHTHTLTGVQPLDSELTAISALSANGIIARTSSTTAAVRTVTGTASRVAVTNGDGVSGNPTIDLIASGVTAATYDRATVDAYGRVTGGLLDTDTWYSLILDSPATNWPVVNTATATADPTYPTLTTRAFDDTRSEGVGILTEVPPGATTMTITIFGRARSTPSGSVNSIWQIYGRRYPVGTASPVWSTAVALTTINNTAGTPQYVSTQTTLAISSLGLVAGQTTQLEVCRVGGSGTDTLVGDYLVATIRIDWT